MLLESSDVTGNLGYGLGADGGGILDAGDCLGANVTGLGTGTGSNGSSIGGNNLTGYGFDNAAPWAILNQNFNFSPAITAEKNNYGAGPSSLIGAVVYDASDNSSLSVVNYGQSGGFFVSPPPNGSASCLSSLPAAPATLAAFSAAGGKTSSSRGSVTSSDSLVSFNGTNYFQRAFTLTDTCGQVGSCAQLFSIIDTTAPVNQHLRHQPHQQCEHLLPGDHTRSHRPDYCH